MNTKLGNIMLDAITRVSVQIKIMQVNPHDGQLVGNHFTERL